MTRVVVCERGFCNHPVLRAEFEARFPDGRLNLANRRLCGAELVDFLRGHEAAIIGAEPIDGPLLDAVPELRIVSKWGVGHNTLDLAAMAARGVRLGITPGVNRLSVAELALSHAIAVLRRVPEANRKLRAGIWERAIGRQLSGATVGLIGCGHVGQAFVRLLVPFGCRLLVYDIRDYPEFYAAHGIEKAGLEDLLRIADVVSLHVPADETTFGMLSAERLALMKTSAVLVNTARGGLVDEAALAVLLRDGCLAGAAFDVFATEPEPDADLLALPNFLATPHAGGSADEALLAMGRAAMDNIAIAEVPAV